MINRDIEVASLHLSATTFKLSTAIDEAGSDVEAWEAIASQFKDLARGAEEFATVLKRSPPEGVKVDEMGVWG